MKYLDGNYYVEVKDHRNKIHRTENIIFRKRDPSISLRTQIKVQNEIEIRRNQKVIREDSDELLVKSYPKKTTNTTTTENNRFSQLQMKQLVRF